MELQNYSKLIGLSEGTTLQIVDMSGSGEAFSLPWAPDKATLVLLGNSALSPKLFLIMTDHYGSTFEVKYQDESGKIAPCQLSKLPTFVHALLIPPANNIRSLESFTDIIGHLRDPETGCPWDKEQTYESLKKHVQEEAYEVMDAINSGNSKAINEELGDLFLLIAMLAQIGQEKNEFSIYTIFQSIAEKMIRRHPHIFADTKVDGVGDVLFNWQKIKAEEKKAKGDHEKGILDGLPRSVPALAQALELQSRAAKVGFDWPTIDGVLDKIVEELAEINNAQDQREKQGELGDLLFVLVNFARWNNIDPEDALHFTNQKFRDRFSYIERQLRLNGQKFEDVDLVQMDKWWNEAKQVL